MGARTLKKPITPTEPIMVPQVMTLDPIPKNPESESEGVGGCNKGGKAWTQTQC